MKPRLDYDKRIVGLEKQADKVMKRRSVATKPHSNGAQEFCLIDKSRFKDWIDTYRQTRQDDLAKSPTDQLWQTYKQTVLDNQYIKCKPLITKDNRSPQAEFLLINKLEVLYGGAAGGGKSTALLAGALQYVDQPAYAALVLRKTIADLSLPGSLLNIAKKWLADTPAKFNASTTTFEFPSGSQLAFGYCENEGDEQRYSGAEFQNITIDELTQWTKKPYEFLFSRLRKTVSLNALKISLRMRSASNPGGVGHQWVKERFMLPVQAPDRAFIPAKPCDNPMLDLEGYLRSLQNLDPVRRAQLQDGDWNINPNGRLFQSNWFSIVENYPTDSRAVRYWDKAATELAKGKDPDYTVGAKCTLNNGVFYIIDIVCFRGSPSTNELTIRRTAEQDGKEVKIFMEQEPGSAGVNDIDNYAINILAGYDFHGVRNTGSKETRAAPLCSFAERGYLRLHRAFWNQELIEQFVLFPDGAHDDIVDAVAGAFSKLTERPPLGGGCVPRVFDRGNVGGSFW